ncbi:MAG: riboflavin synthase [Paenibacillaceae bacterium]
MFTGIIEEVGRLRSVQSRGQSMVLTIEANKVLEGIQLGDSISVNGVCLTAVAHDTHSFSVDVMPETYRQTNISKLGSGARVNLERAMQAGGRFGGHIVQGHIDGCGVIRARHNEENAVVYAIEPDHKNMFRHIIGRGSITIDGISLTVVRVDETTFTVSIIPHTLAQTILNEKRAGDVVNLETDILGKYIEHLMSYREPVDSGNHKSNNKNSPITAAFLSENGFI